MHLRSPYQRLPWVFVAVSLVHGLQAFDGVWEKIMEMVKDSACQAYLSGHLLG